MNKGNRNKTWLIITAIIIGIACVPVSGMQPVGFTNSVFSDWTSLVPDVTPLNNGIADIVPGIYSVNRGGRMLCPDLKAGSLSYPSTVNSGGKFTITMTVTNSGTISSLKTGLLVRLPGDVVIPMPTTVPPLKSGETKEITFTITIPPGISIGNAPFTVTLDPDQQNYECSLTNNEVSGTTFVLPAGMTKEEYESQTSPPVYKITGQPFVNPLQGGGGPLPP